MITRRLAFVLVIVFILFLMLFETLAMAQVDHQLSVALDPHSHHIEVIDRMKLSSLAVGEFDFFLHDGLHPKVLNETMLLIEGDLVAGAPVPLRSYRVLPLSLPLALTSTDLGTQFQVQYYGEIYHPGAELPEGGLSDTPGLIDDQGVYLTSSSYWYPTVDDEMITFDLSVRFASPAWSSVSQGRRETSSHSGNGSDRWISLEPQDEITLMAYAFTVYEKMSNGLLSSVYLRTPDEALAQKYLDVTAHYVEMYSRLLGAYAYPKFSAVENFWETGYGLPSYTLLGPSVIRLPFILTSSYPHEILHNWWGNGVFVDYDQGNWCEGLTAYLADFYLSELLGKGAEYRRNSLQKFRDSVNASNDFSLREFRERHGMSSSAIGYDKALMVNHMMRAFLGDDRFFKGLRLFYKNFLFKKASWKNLADSFKSVATESEAAAIDRYYLQWLYRTGAPDLRLESAQATKEGDRAFVTAVLTQAELDLPFELNVPVELRQENSAGQAQVVKQSILVRAAKAGFQIEVPHGFDLSREIELRVDSEFNVFRRLDRLEIPPAVSQIFGSSKVTFVLPSKVSETERAAMVDVAKAWAALVETADVEIKVDTELNEIPKDRSVLVMGWTNKYLGAVLDQSLMLPIKVSDASFFLDGVEFSRARSSAAWVTRISKDSEFALGFVGFKSIASIKPIGRKLSHYGKASYVAFDGDEAVMSKQGSWQATQSPLNLKVLVHDSLKAGPR